MRVTPYFSRLSISFGRVYALLEKPRAARRSVVMLVTVHTCLLAYSAYVHSPTLNEPGHLVAGLSHWEFGRFELYRVNPPLVRMVASLPVMAAGYEEDWSEFHEGPGARPVFAMGEDLVAANGDRSFFLFMIARWACIPFSWVGGLVCYLWARDLYGRPSGVLACTFWCFSPNILAHASIITADVGGTALGIAACYTFWYWLKKPTWTQAALTGCVLGLAELTKTTLILFYPLWPLLWVIYRWPSRKSIDRQRWLREAGMLVLRMTIGMYVLNLGYGFEGSGQQLKEFYFVSNLFTGRESRDERPEPDGGPSAANPQPEISIPKSTNRFADTWLGAMPVPFPKNYLLGIDIQQRDFEDYGRPSYLRGVWQDHGWWYYYLYAAAIKVPLGFWLLGVFALLIVFSRLSRRGRGPQNSEHLAIRNSNSALDTVFLLTPPLIIFAVVSAKCGFNEHFRYVLPCFPFLFIWFSRIAVLCLPQISWNSLETGKSHAKFCGSVENLVKGRVASFAYSTLLLWSVASSMWIYPHSLSYFNESIGGPLSGAEHLLGSNVDWGQDLRYLKWCLEDHSEAGPLYLAYYGYFDPGNVGLESIAPSDVSDTASVKSFDLGCYVVSISFLHGYSWLAGGDEGGKKSFGPDALRILRGLTPSIRVSYSICLYKVSEETVSRQAP